MQVVLNAKVPNLGHKGDIVEVKPGYFRNYLYGMGLADVATKSRVKVAEDRKKRATMRAQQVKDNAQEVLQKLSGLAINLQEKVNEKGHLYAAVSEKEVSEAILEAKKLEIAPEFIKMDHLKELGEHQVTISFGPQLQQEITIKIEAKA